VADAQQKIRGALEDLSQNISCPQSIQDQVADILAQNPVERKTLIRRQQNQALFSPLSNLQEIKSIYNEHPSFMGTQSKFELTADDLRETLLPSNQITKYLVKNEMINFNQINQK
jgi:hypothetical protein